MRKRFIISVLSLVVLTFGIAACGSGSSTPTEGPEPTEYNITDFMPNTLMNYTLKTHNESRSQYTYVDASGKELNVIISAYISVKQATRELNKPNSSEEDDIAGLPSPSAFGYEGDYPDWPGFYAAYYNKFYYLVEVKLDSKDTTLDPVKRDLVINFAKGLAALMP